MELVLKIHPVPLTVLGVTFIALNVGAGMVTGAVKIKADEAKNAKQVAADKQKTMEEFQKKWNEIRRRVEAEQKLQNNLNSNKKDDT